MSSENDTDNTSGARRRLSKKAVIAISVVAALALAGGTAFAINAANQAKINAACQEASTSYAAAVETHSNASQQLADAVTEARDEAARGYVDTEEGAALIASAEELLAAEAPAAEAPACDSIEAAAQTDEQTVKISSDAKVIDEKTVTLSAAVDEHIINTATTDYDAALTAYNESKTAGEASYEAANNTEGFAASAENDGKLEALRAALDAVVITDATAATRDEIEALDTATAEINTAKTAIDEAKAAIDTAKTTYHERTAAEKAAAEKAAADAEAARAAEAARKAEQARKNQTSNNNSSKPSSSSSSSSNSGNSGSPSGTGSGGSVSNTPKANGSLEPWEALGITEERWLRAQQCKIDPAPCT